MDPYVNPAAVYFSRKFPHLNYAYCKVETYTTIPFYFVDQMLF